MNKNTWSVLRRERRTIGWMWKPNGPTAIHGKTMKGPSNEVLCFFFVNEINRKKKQEKSPTWIILPSLVFVNEKRQKKKLFDVIRKRRKCVVRWVCVSVREREREWKNENRRGKSIGWWGEKNLTKKEKRFHKVLKILRFFLCASVVAR